MRGSVIGWLVGWLLAAAAVTTGGMRMPTVAVAAVALAAGCSTGPGGATAKQAVFATSRGTFLGTGSLVGSLTVGNGAVFAPGNGTPGGPQP